MNRIIKFRVWNGMEMVYDIMAGKFGVFYVNPGYKKDGLDERDSACLTTFNTKYLESVNIMQFTGLLDKNGREIYEGDIVRGDSDTSWSRYRIGIITYDNDSMSFYIKDSKLDCGLSLFYNTLYIIGNIFENPSLLAENQQK